MNREQTLNLRGMRSDEGGSRTKLLALIFDALVGSLREGVTNKKVGGPTAIWIAAPKTFAEGSEEITRRPKRSMEP